MNREKYEMLTCEKCGKTGYKNKEALSRHQQRSKICQAVKELPIQLSVEQQMEKLGLKLVNK